MDKMKAEAAAEAIFKDFASALVEDYSKKFREIFDKLDPALVVELSEEAAEIMKKHDIRAEVYDGAILESALMWILYQQSQKA